MPDILIVAIGGAIGAALRYLTGISTKKILGKSKIYTGTVIANIFGCFLSGLIIGWIVFFDPDLTNTLLFLTTGVLGAYTTFSTFALESLQLLRYSVKSLLIYLLLQVIIAVSAVATGYGLIYWICGMAA